MGRNSNILCERQTCLIIGIRRLLLVRKSSLKKRQARHRVTKMWHSSFMILEGTLENKQEEGRHTVGTTGQKTGQACHKQKNAQKIRSTQMVLMRKNEHSVQQSHSQRLQVWASSRVTTCMCRALCRDFTSSTAEANKTHTESLTFQDN